MSKSRRIWQKSVGCCWAFLGLILAVGADDFSNDEYPTPRHLDELLQKLRDRDLQAAPLASVVSELGDIKSNDNYEALWLRHQAADGLAEENSRIIPKLIKALKDPEAEVRRIAAHAFIHLGPVVRDAVPALIEAMDDPHTQWASAYALRQLGSSATEEVVDALIGKLEDRHHYTMGEAPFIALSRIGAVAEKAVPALLEAIRDDERREKVKQIAEKIKNPDLPIDQLAAAVDELDDLTFAVSGIIIQKYAAPRLAKALSDEERSTRIAAAQTLRDLSGNEDLKVAIPAIEKALEDKEQWIRRLAVEALKNMGPAAARSVGALLVAMKHTDFRTRECAAEALGEIGPAAAEAVGPLIHALETDPDGDVRACAAGALPRIGMAARPALPALMKALKDPHGEVRAEAISAISLFIPTPSGLIQVAADRFVSDEYSWARLAAAQILKDRKRQAVTVLPVLIKGLKHKDPGIRRSVSEMLGNFGSEAKAAIPALLEGLEDADASVNVASARALWGMEKKHREAILTSLLKSLKDKDAGVRIAAASTLWWVDKHHLAPVLVTLIGELDARDSRSRWEAADALGRLGAKAEPSVSKLIQALGDEDKRVRSSAVQALAEIGELAHVAVPEVTRLLRDEEQHVRRSAAECIGKIASSEVAIPILMAAMRDENCYVRSCAARSLARFGKDAAPAIPELIKSLRHDWVRVDATITLAEIGKSAVPALLQALKGEKDYARCNAIDILGRMGKDALEAVEAIEEAANQDELLKDKAVEAIKKIQGGE